MTILLAAVLLPSVSGATPIDTAWDVLYAVENNDGYAFLDLLSETVRGSLDTAFAQVKQLAEDQPEMAQALLDRTGTGLTAWDVVPMDLETFVSVMLEDVMLPSLDQIQTENVSMSGRNAQVDITWHGGYSLTFMMVWENSSWRITGSSIIDRLF
ncbi:MAG: hypothetical protein GF388_12200 [Candidatus Aegiribacteria sp.]|nr:hypothetical protein [Candidatus Aegiribacteria sp.]MBD3295714.1 hypothetical protein [Candidatus Fermentibacteria bacterium]